MDGNGSPRPAPPPHAEQPQSAVGYRHLPYQTRFERGFMPLVVFAIVAGVAGIGLDIWQDLTGIAAGLFTAAALGPFLGALAAWIVYRRTLAELLPAPVARRQVVAHLILGVAAGALLVATMFVVLALLGVAIAVPAEVNGFPFAATLFGVVVAAALQEVGIRGLAQPLLELGGRRLLATVVVGVVWAFWVVQLYPVAPTAITAGAVVLAMFAFAILLGYLGNGSVAQRLAVTVVVHGLVAVALVVAGGGGATTESIALAFLAASWLTTAVFMTLFVLAQRKRARRRLAAATEPI